MNLIQEVIRTWLLKKLKQYSFTDTTKALPALEEKDVQDGQPKR